MNRAANHPAAMDGTLSAMIPADTPLWKLTAGEFRALVADAFMAAGVAPATEANGGERAGKWLVKGIDGLADLIGCGRTKAMALKATGLLDPAITQVGRSIVIDAEMALRLIREKGDHATIQTKKTINQLKTKKI